MINVIIADDDARARKGLTNLIDWEELDAQIVLVAEDGTEVVNVLDKLHVDLIISDIKMPNMDGIELSRYIYEHSYGIDIIILSAYGEFEYAKEALKYGVRDYILKPINRNKIQLLIKMISEVAKQHENEAKLSELIYNSDFVKSVKSALENTDIDYIKQIMNLHPDLQAVNSKMIKQYYLLLIGILCDYITSQGIVYVDKQLLVQEFMQLSVLKEYSSFTLGKYLDILTFKNIKKGTKQIVEFVKMHIEDKYAEQYLSTNTIAEYLNLSISYLCAVFKAEEGITIVEYITNKKIEKAMQLLNETNMMVNKVAKAVGYENERYFTTVFKKKVGLSPSDYVQRGQKK